MEMFKESEIMRLNLDTVVLRLLSLGFKDVENFDFIQKPEEKYIKESYESLGGIGAINILT